MHRLKPFFLRKGLVVILNASFIEAANTLSLTSESFAWMPTWHDFRTTLFHQLDALWLSADVLESLLVTQRWLSQFLPTESTLQRGFEIRCLLTSPPKMVGLLFTACTEVL